MSLYGKLYKMLAKLIRRVYRVELNGIENEPENGAFLVCANHLSFQDVIILAACLKHQLRFVAKAELFKIPLLGGLIRELGAIPIDRKKGDVGALKKSIALLEGGEVVSIYPQGHRNPGVHPAKTEIKAGVGLVVTKAKVNVLPVCIQTKKFKIKLFRKVYVTFGELMTYDEFGISEGGKSEYERITSAVFDNICSMVKEDI